MTTREITEGNKRIAEFHGGRYIPEKDWVKYDVDTMGEFALMIHAINVKANNLRYHESWDWLMPVVEKIEELEDGEFMFEICGHRAEISTMVNHNWPTDKSTMFLENASSNENKISSVYKVVVEFINWYNKQNQ